MTQLAIDRVRQLSTGAPGTGNITLSGIVPGHSAFSSVLSIGDTFNYCISDIGNSLWEIGIGQYSASNTVTRLVVKSSSSAGAFVNFVSGTRDVFMTSIVQDNELYPNVLPSLSLDFVNSDEYLDPRLVFSRSSIATRYNVYGNIETVAANVPRFDYDPLTKMCKGLLMEESRTNLITNSECGGSTNGVVGSGGAYPTSWQAAQTPVGISCQVVGSGTELGVGYYDLRIFGTTSNLHPLIGSIGISMVSSTNYTLSVWCKVVSGSASNISFGAGGGTGAFDGVGTFVPTSTFTRYSGTGTTSSGVTTLYPWLHFSLTLNNAYDFTVRIGGFQMEAGTFSTSYIPTTTAAVTRAVDNCYMNNVQQYMNVSEGVVTCEYIMGCLDSNFRHPAAFVENNVPASQLTFYQYPSSISAKISYWPALSQFEPNNYNSSMVVGSTIKAAMSYASNYAISSINGNGYQNGVDSAVVVPSTINKLYVGNPAGIANPICGWIRSIQHFPKSNPTSVVPLSL